MIFPKLSNAQKARVVKNLGYESEGSDDGNEQEQAEKIFDNPYDSKDSDDVSAAQNDKNIDTKLLLKRIRTFSQQPPEHHLSKQQNINNTHEDVDPIENQLEKDADDDDEEG